MHVAHYLYNNIKWGIENNLINGKIDSRIGNDATRVRNVSSVITAKSVSLVDLRNTVPGVYAF